MGEVVRFHLRGIRGPRRLVPAGASAQIHILPVVRIERHGEPDERGFERAGDGGAPLDRRTRLR